MFDVGGRAEEQKENNGAESDGREDENRSGVKDGWRGDNRFVHLDNILTRGSRE